MALNFQSTPVTNTMVHTVHLYDGLIFKASLASNAAAVLTCSFNRVHIINPGFPPIVKNQNPPAHVNVIPGRVAFIQQPGANVEVKSASPGMQEQTTLFV